MAGHGGLGIHLEHIHRYRLAAEVVEGEVIDVGCGVGHGSRLFARRATRVVGVDVSLAALEAAASIRTPRNVTYVPGDVRALPFAAASFDWAVCFELLEHVVEGEAVVAEAARVLKPGGRLLLSTPNRQVYDERRGDPNPFHLREYDEGELRALLSTWFDDVVLWGQRLVAASVVAPWQSGSRAASSMALLPPGDLPPEVDDAREAVYFIALCGRRAAPVSTMSESAMAGRLARFAEESEQRLKVAYESVVQDLVRRLTESDFRLRELGQLLEQRTAEYQAKESGSAESVAKYEQELRRLVDRLTESDRRARQLGTEIEMRATESDSRLRELGQLLEQRTAEFQTKESGSAESLAKYQEELRRLLDRLSESDRRTRELGSEIETRTAAHAQHINDLQARREAEMRRQAEERREVQAAYERRIERQAIELAAQSRALLESEARFVEQATLIAQQAETLEKVRQDLYWSYEHWQERERELRSLQESSLWRVWTGYHAVRRAVTGAARRLGRLVLFGPLRFAGSCFLCAWTVWTWLAALVRGRPGLEAHDEPAPAAKLPRRPRVLIVCPYPIVPVHHGGGVRLVNLIRRLRCDCDLQILVFIRADDDPVQRAVLEGMVEKVHFQTWRPELRPDLWGLKPRSVQLFESEEARARIAGILSRERIDILQIEYAELGQYGMPEFAGVKVVLSEIDVHFRSRARRRRAGMHRRFRNDRIWGFSMADWMRLMRYELRVARRVDQIHFMSGDDARYVGRFLPGAESKSRIVPNAVDTDHFRPPDGPRDRRLLFLGNFQHLPNLDALEYLVESLWPQIRLRHPDAELAVVGADGGEAVQRWDGRDGVAVIGTVEDTAPYYRSCRALVAPIRAASGTRLKILEALACSMPVVSTSIGAEGIDGEPGVHFLIGDGDRNFVDAVCRLIESDELCNELGRAGRQLVETRYTWDVAAAAARAGYGDLLAEHAKEVDPHEPAPRALEMGSSGGAEVSIVIPTLQGGAVLARCLEAIGRQRTSRDVEVICIDSGSPAADLEMMAAQGARIVPIDRSDFNHGLTRDRGAAAGSGRVLVFLNQDAVPCDSEWLERLIAPLLSEAGCAAVQGGILEVPERERRFYWDSGGKRFYFTRESRRWIERYFGVGFSTVNAAIRRDVWERHPFGHAPIMEDKKWQREVVEAGYYIASVPAAAVHHTHNYGLRSLIRRCQSEGFGWRLLGERYSLADAMADMLTPRIYGDLVAGVLRGQVRSAAELLFPFLRPLAVYGGNRWGTEIRS